MTDKNGTIVDYVIEVISVSSLHLTMFSSGFINIITNGSHLICLAARKNIVVVALKCINNVLESPISEVMTNTVFKKKPKTALVKYHHRRLAG